MLPADVDKQEFESVCIRRKDGTIDLEPANLARMCTLVADNTRLPYRQNKKAAGYHVYAKNNVKLPARSAVTVDIGYRVYLKCGLTIHTFAPARLRGRHIVAEGILNPGPVHTASKIQMVNLAPYDQQISKGATLCSAIVTKKSI